MFQLNLSGLDPAKRYTIALTSNRDQTASGDERWTDLELLSADSATEASGGTTTVVSPTHVRFGSWDNTTRGDLARWTTIDPGPDGDFSVVTTLYLAGDSDRSYVPVQLMLAEEGPTGPITHTLVYDANGGTGSQTDPGSPYADGATVTVLGAGSMAKAGSTFAGWNTLANGSGTGYVADDTFTISADTTLYAQWTPITHTLVYDANGGTGSQTDPGSPYADGATVTVLGAGSMAKAGSTFAGWNTLANGSGTGYVADDTFTISADTTLYAQWTPITHTLVYDANGGTGSQTDPGSPYADGATVTVLGAGSMAKAGSTFAGWNTLANGSGTGYVADDTFTISADTTLYAQWTPITHTLVYDANGGTGSQTDPGSPYADGATVTVLGAGSMAKAGSTFAGWNTLANGSGTGYVADDTFTISADTTLYAQWTPITHTLVYDANGGTGSQTDPGSPYADGATVTVLGAGSMAKAGSTFAGWNTLANGSGTGYVADDTFTISADTTLYAQWTPITHTLVYDANGGTGSQTDPGSPYADGATVTVLGAGSMAKAGSTFAGWNTLANGSGTGYVADDTFTISADTTLYAQWTPITHTLVYDANGGTGSQTDPGSPYADGATVTVLGAGSMAKAGSTFAGWNTLANGSGTGYVADDTFTISADTTLYAQWTPITHTLVYDANGGTGSQTDPGSPYADGATVTVLGAGSMAKAGSTFAGWNTLANGSGTGYVADDTFTISADTTLYAQWTPITHTLVYDANGGTGSQTDPGSPYADGATVTVLGAGSMAKAGSTFAGWNTLANGSGTGYVADDTFTISADTTLYAQWTPITHTLVYDANGGTGSQTDPGSPYADGATVTVLGAGSMAKAGSTFAGWNTLANGSGTGYVADDTFTISADTTLYAQWTPITHTLVYDANGGTGSQTDPGSPYADGATVTVLGAGSMAKAGSTFAGWNTLANGSGTGYVADDTFTISADTTLYAQWTPITHTLVYDANGGTGSQTDPGSPYADGATVTVLGAGSMAKAGSTFAGWNTLANGSGTGYVADDTFTISADTTLYAQWTPITHTLSGTVTAGVSGLDGAIVYVFDAGTDAYVGNATTAGGGAFNLVLPPGHYKLWIQTNTGDYPDQAYGPDGTFANATDIDLTAGNGTADVVLAAAPITHTLSGTVTAGISGLDGAIVYVFDAGTDAYVGNATTAGGGAFNLVLPPGHYKLWIQTNTGDYPDQAYGPDGTFANATDIDLTAGNGTADVVLAAAPITHTLSGTVTAGISGLDGAIVYVFNAGTDAYVGNATTAGGGAFNLVLPPGHYKLWIQTNTGDYPDQAYGPDGTFANATDIDLTAGNGTADVVLAAAPITHTLSGTVTAGISGLDGAIVYVFDAGTDAYVGNATTAGGGAFNLVLPPGHYKLWIQTNTGDYPDQAYGPDGTFANATDIDLTAGNGTADVVLAAAP